MTSATSDTRPWSVSDIAPLLGYHPEYVRSLLRTAEGREALPVRPWRVGARGHWRFSDADVRRVFGEATR